jgi:hypothetical protein
LPKPKEGDI